MLQYANYVAKAIVAFAIPAAALLADLASQWLGITEDGVIEVNEAHVLILAAITAVGVFIKKNGPDPEEPPA